MKKFIVVIGNFGSGKTELSLNMAFDAARSQRTTLVDLDIINPYFRSTERKKELESAGVRLLSPTFAMMGVEVPSLPAEIYSVFSDNSETVIFDVGGDPAGAIALGQYKRFFEKESDVEVYYVINARRPFSCDADKNLDMISRITQASRMEITAIINNTNLSQETTADDLMDGYEIVKQIACIANLPVVYTSGMPEVLETFMERAADAMLDRAYIGEPLRIIRYMHRDWERFTTKGL